MNSIQFLSGPGLDWSLFQGIHQIVKNPTFNYNQFNFINCIMSNCGLQCKKLFHYPSFSKDLLKPALNRHSMCILYCSLIDTFIVSGIYWLKSRLLMIHLLRLEWKYISSLLARMGYVCIHSFTAWKNSFQDISQWNFWRKKHP